jgi:hypothetical protein
MSEQLKPTELSIDMQLPCHTEELAKADEIINTIKSNLKTIINDKSITGNVHLQLYEETIRILDYVGRLSQPLFDIEDHLEQMYTMHYKSCPELGKKLFNDHYEKLHYPYTLLKNRCFKILEDLDEEYELRWDKKPPNWNI